MSVLDGVYAEDHAGRHQEPDDQPPKRMTALMMLVIIGSSGLASSSLQLVLGIDEETAERDDLGALVDSPSRTCGIQLALQASVNLLRARIAGMHLTCRRRVCRPLR